MAGTSAKNMYVSALDRRNVISMVSISSTVVMSVSTALNVSSSLSFLPGETEEKPELLTSQPFTLMLSTPTRTLMSLSFTTITLARMKCMESVWMESALKSLVK